MNEHANQDASTFDDAHSIEFPPPHGDPGTSQLHRSIELATGNKIDTRRCSNTESSIGALMVAFQDHQVGKKEGTYFLQGALAGKRRVADAVKHLDLMTFDVDNGTPFDDIRSLLAEHNLLSVVYTTHSSGKDQSEIGRDHLLKHFNLAKDAPVTIKLVEKYLLEVKDYHPSVLAFCEILDDGTGPTGVMIIKHAPMTRCRIVLFLQERFELPSDKNARKAAIASWKKHYVSVAAWLGIKFDKSCADLSRAFYFPRHPEGGEFCTEVSLGSLLDLRAVPASENANDPSHEHTFLHEASLQNGWLKRFVAQYGKGFEAADCVEDYLDCQPSSGGFVAGGCPNKDAHSNPGDEDDKGFFAMNASDSETGSFVMGCHHDGCSDMDRLAMLDLTVSEFGLTEDDLMEYVVMPEEDVGIPDAVSEIHSEGNARSSNRAEWTREDWFGYFNENFAVVAVNGQSFVVRIRPGHNLEYFPKQHFLLPHENCRYIEGSGKDQRSVCAAREWLKDPDRRTYDGVCFDPSGEPLGEIDGQLNQWTGFGVNPSEGDWSLMRDHIFNVVCRGDEEYFAFFMTWMAQLLQFPAEKIGSAIVLLGEKGTGKTFVFDVLRHIIGARHSIKIDKAEHLTGRFNSQLETALLAQLEEASWGGDKSAEGVMKNLITSEEILIEAKGRIPHMAMNCSRIAITSNEQWVIPASADERRFFVLEASNAKKGDNAYFSAISRQLKNGGYEAMMHDLMIFQPKSDLGWDVLRSPPKTPWLNQQIDQSKSSIERFVDELFELGEADFDDDLVSQPMEWHDGVCFQPSVLHKQYARWCQLNGIRRVMGNGNGNLIIREIEKRVALNKVRDTVRGKHRGTFYDVVGDWDFHDA